MVTTRDVEYQVAGATYRGRLAVPDGPGPFPAVLVAHEANGLDEYQAERPARLAALGYVAFALDYIGDGRVMWTDEEMGAHLAELSADVDHLRALAQAGLDVLTSEPTVDADRVAAIGFCFGGTMAMELARTGVDLKAVVGIHPGINSFRPQDTPRIRARVLMCIGDADPLAPPEVRAAFASEMTDAGVDWQVHVYGGVLHSFSHPHCGRVGNAALRYDPVAEARSWQAMLNLLDETLRPD